MDEGYVAEGIWMTADEAREYWERRLFLDMVAVLDRTVQQPVYREETIPEWVAKGLAKDIADAMHSRDGYRRGLEQMLRQLASPPPPWKTFGTISALHDVVFWGDDGTGLPIWERKVMDRQAMAEHIAERRRTSDISRAQFRGEPPLDRDYEAADIVNDYLKGD